MNEPRFPVVFGICLDAEAIWLAINPANQARPAHLSHGTFEIREGLAALLSLLRKHDVPATFFVPGMTARRYPDAVRLIADHGHELGSHSETHRSPIGLSFEEERQELRLGIEAIETLTGARPCTWRSPSWDWSDHTLDLLLAEGVTVSTNFHDSVAPYRHQQDGRPLPLVELPVQWHLADAPYFIHGGRMERVIRSSAEVERIWLEEFEGSYHWPGAFFHLTLHVQLIAMPGRLRMLDRLIATLKRHPRTEFMTSATLAARVP
ncbi:MAG: polysaccharide deacetylase family protein [Pigmentiphaga sp.]